MKTRDLPVFPVTADPVRSGVARDTPAVHLDIEGVGPEDGPRFGLVTLGCDKNTVDSERMMAALVGGGARVSSDLAGAEVVIVNTCGFIHAAKEESVTTLLEACALKGEGRVKAVVGVGCLVQRYKHELEAEIPEVDLFLGLTEMGGLLRELRRRGLLPEQSSAIPNMERPLRILSTQTPQFQHVGAFAYSVDEGTPAADMPGQVEPAVKNERIEELMQVQQGISLDRNLERIGAIETVLVDTVSDDDPTRGTGRTGGQAMEIDGVTHLSSSVALRAGTFVRAEVTDGGEYDLEAAVLVS